VELGETPVPVRFRPGRPWIGLTSSYALYVAYDARTHARIRSERQRLLWAAGCGVPVPAVVAHGPAWLVTARAAGHEPLSDGSFASAVVSATRRIGAATPPPGLGHGRETPGWNRVRTWHLSLLLERTVSWHEYRSLGRAVAGLTKDQLAHGDFSIDNVLFDRRDQSVTLIDWELLSYKPAHYDLCKLWPRLALDTDRDIVLEAALAGTRDRAALGLLHHWLAMRYLVGLVRTPRSEQDPDRIATMAARVAESRRNAKRWAA
jgi:aminoglycoside phosphotransferase